MEHSREKVLREIARCEGNMRRMAAFLGVCRSRVYQLVNAHDLWPAMNEARAARLKREPVVPLLQRASRVLKG